MDGKSSIPKRRVFNGFAYALSAPPASSGSDAQFDAFTDRCHRRDAAESGIFNAALGAPTRVLEVDVGKTRDAEVTKTAANVQIDGSRHLATACMLCVGVW
jgi:hypothetical protein